MGQELFKFDIDVLRGFDFFRILIKCLKFLKDNLFHYFDVRFSSMHCHVLFKGFWVMTDQPKVNDSMSKFVS